MLRCPKHCETKKRTTKNDTYVPKGASFNLNIARLSFTPRHAQTLLFLKTKTTISILVVIFPQVGRKTFKRFFTCFIRSPWLLSFGAEDVQFMIYQLKISQTSLLLGCGIGCARLFILNIVWCCFMMRDPYFNSGGGGRACGKIHPQSIPTIGLRHGRMYLGMHSPVDIVQSSEVNYLNNCCW